MTDVFNVCDFGAWGNGVSDDSTVINALVDRLGLAGGGTIYFPPGIFRVSVPIKLRSNLTYLGSGWGSVIQRHPESSLNIFGDAVQAPGVTAVKIQNLRIDGNREICPFNADDANGNSIRFMGVSQSEISSCWIHHSIFNAISLYSVCDGIIVDRCLIEQVGKSGTPPGASSQIGVYLEFGTSRCIVSRCQIRNTLQDGVTLRSGGADVYNNKILHNTISTCAGDGVRMAEDEYATAINRTLVQGNTFGAIGEAGIRLQNSAGGHCYDTIISENFINGAKHGVLLGDGCEKTTVTGNNVRACSVAGLVDGGTSDKTIMSSNLITECATPLITKPETFLGLNIL